MLQNLQRIKDKVVVAFIDTGANVRKNFSKVLFELSIHHWSKNFECTHDLHFDLQILGLLVLLQQVQNYLRVNLDGLLCKNVAIIDFCNINQVLKCFEDVQFHVVISLNESFRKEISELEPVILEVGLTTGDNGVNDLS